MEKKELRRVRRTQLLEMLLEQKNRADALEEELKRAKEELAERDIQITNAGSIAEASMRLNDVFSVAQAAADQYLDNVRRLAVQQQDQIEQKNKEASKRLLAMETETKVRCEQMLNDAKTQSKEYWDEVRMQLDSYYEAHRGLQEILAKPVQFTKAIDEQVFSPDMMKEAEEAKATAEEAGVTGYMRPVVVKNDDEESASKAV